MGESVINRWVDIDKEKFSITCVSMGNPHCVIFFDSIDNLDVKNLGMMFENHPLFPERINTEFVQIMSDHVIKMRVWERGATAKPLACGTGACAAAVARSAERLLQEGRGYPRCRQGRRADCQLYG